MEPRLSPPPPSIEERLCAAAHGILTDGRPHAYQAKRWAVHFLSDAAPGERTSFTRQQLRRLATNRSTTQPRRGHVPT